MNKQRYNAIGLTNWGVLDEDGGFIAGNEDYKECRSDSLAEAIKAAEDASIIDEFQVVYLEQYRPEFGDWEVVDHIDPYGPAHEGFDEP